MSKLSELKDKIDREANAGEVLSLTWITYQLNQILAQDLAPVAEEIYDSTSVQHPDSCREHKAFCVPRITAVLQKHFGTGEKS